MKKVFYSWQSDAHRKINRDFIERCLRKAAANIQRSSGSELEVQDGVRGEPGTPPLADTIFSRIAAANIYVADISLVYQVEGSDGKRLAPNPNVAIELGYAFASLSLDRIVSIQNTYFGGPDQLPFDLQHLRWPLRYTLQPGASKEDIAKQSAALTRPLETAMTLILKNDRPRAVLLAKRTEVSLALANLIEQNGTWQLALKRHDLKSEELKFKALAIADKIKSFTDRCQHTLLRTSAIATLEQMRHAIVEMTLMIAGTPQRTELLALDLARQGRLCDLIRRIATKKDQLDKLHQEQAEIDAELAEVEAEQGRLVAESLERDQPESNA